MKKMMTIVLFLFSLMVMAGTSPKSAYEEVKAGKAVLIDVREKEEIEKGMIERAFWFPLSKVKTDENWKEEFSKLTEGKKIYLHCRSGRRSGEVKDILEREEIKAENLGGFETLKNELPVIVPKK